mgnify:CR=1 FL=1
MLFKDFITLFDLDETNITIRNDIEELRFYCSNDYYLDDLDDLLELYSHFDVLEAYTSMHSYRYSVSVPCLVVVLDFFGSE